MLQNDPYLHQLSLCFFTQRNVFQFGEKQSHVFKINPKFVCLLVRLNIQKLYFVLFPSENVLGLPSCKLVLPIFKISKYGGLRC